MKKSAQNFLLIIFFLLLGTWGIVTTLMYFGVSVHGAVLMTQEAQNAVAAACPNNSSMCRGIESLLPILSNLLTQLKPFAVYGITMGILYALFIAGFVFIHGHARLRFSLKPWHIYVLFLGAIWFMFTVLSNMPAESANQIGIRQIVEPVPQVYTSLSAAALGHMKEYITMLEGKNCLRELATNPGSVKVYELKTVCIQGFFIKRVLSQFLFLTLLVAFFLTVGKRLLALLKVEKTTALQEAIFSIILGVAATIAFMWLLAVFAILNKSFVVTIMIITVLLLRKYLAYWFNMFLHYEWECDTQWNQPAWFFAGLLLSFLALNFLTVIRPFPIGWDDLGVYLNEPRLLTSYGHLTPFMSTFRWEYITSLGFILFGYNSYFGATAAMLINWSAGLLAVTTILGCVWYFSSARVAILTALLYYMTPIIGHFSFADMKTDNAVFVFQTLALCLIVQFCHGYKNEESVKKLRPLLVLAGIVLAIGFATKITATMMLFATIAIITSLFYKKAGFIAVMAATFIVYAFQGVLNIQQISGKIGIPFSKSAFIAVMLCIFVACIAIAIRKKVHLLKPLALVLAYYIGTFILCIAPWLLYNNVQHGNIIPRIITDTVNTLSPSITYDTLPAELKVDTTNPVCNPSAKTEELDRYWGYDGGISHYLLLPWRQVMNIDIFGYYVTSYPLVLLFPLILLLAFFWKPENFWLRSIVAGTIFYGTQWLFLGNGVIWYGIGMFAGIALSMAMLTAQKHTWQRVIVYVFICISIVSAVGMRLWQFGLQKNMLEYAIGKSNATMLEDRTIPYYGQISEQIESRKTQYPSQPYVYRVGTFIPYFIPKNYEVIGVADHQLDFFNCLNQENNHALTLQRLQALGINSIIFDTNTATIERDQNGSLHKKVNSFVSFLNNRSIGIVPLVNAPDAGISYALLPIK